MTISSSLDILKAMLVEFPGFFINNNDDDVNGGDLVDFFADFIADYPELFGLNKHGYRHKDWDILMERLKSFDEFL